MKYFAKVYKFLCLLLIFFLLQCKPVVITKEQRKKEVPRSELAKLKKEIEELEARIGLIKPQ